MLREENEMTIQDNERSTDLEVGQELHGSAIPTLRSTVRLRPSEEKFHVLKSTFENITK